MSPTLTVNAPGTGRTNSHRSSAAAAVGSCCCAEAEVEAAASFPFGSAQDAPGAVAATAAVEVEAEALPSAGGLWCELGRGGTRTCGAYGATNHTIPVRLRGCRGAGPQPAPQANKA